MRHNIPCTPYDKNILGLRHSARSTLKGPPIYFQFQHAETLLRQFQETATHRQWELLAVGIMCNHFHIVVGVPGDPEPEDLLRDFKAYGSRALNRRWGKPVSETWWTESGSTRKLPAGQAVRDATEYVRNQPNPLLIWTKERGIEFPAGERGA